MEEKYYFIWFNKRYVKKEDESFKAYDNFRKCFRSFGPNQVLLRNKSGIISCKDAYSSELASKMPIIVRVSEYGCFDYITDKKIEIIEPIELYEEKSLEEVYYLQSSLRQDHSSFIKYYDAVISLINIIDDFKTKNPELAQSNGFNPNPLKGINESSYTRCRNKFYSEN